MFLQQVFVAGSYKAGEGVAWDFSGKKFTTSSTLEVFLSKSIFFLMPTTSSV